MGWMFNDTPTKNSSSQDGAIKYNSEEIEMTSM